MRKLFLWSACSSAVRVFLRRPGAGATIQNMPETSRTYERDADQEPVSEDLSPEGLPSASPLSIPVVATSGQCPTARYPTDPRQAVRRGLMAL